MTPTMHTHTKKPVKLHVLNFAAAVEAPLYNAECDSDGSDFDDRDRHSGDDHLAEPQTRLSSPRELIELQKQRSSIDSIEYGRWMKKILVNTLAATPPTSALLPIPHHIELESPHEHLTPAHLWNQRLSLWQVPSPGCCHRCRR